MTASSGLPLTPLTISSEGLTLAVWEGPDNGPPLVFVHGFPDTHVVWEPVIERLADRFHCIAYDVRGAGASDSPTARADYFSAHLVTDLIAVLDGFSPDAPVHVVGHDWGSVQAWDAVISEPSDARLTGRIASFTSISGPCLDHVRAFAKASWQGNRAQRQQALRQAGRSWYIYAFQVPALPEVVLRRLSERMLIKPADDSHHFAATLPADAAHGVNLYRANLRHRPRFPGGPRTSLPVQLIIALRDKYVAPALARSVSQFATDLTPVEMDAGHWVPCTHPDELARHIDDFVTQIESRPS